MDQLEDSQKDSRATMDASSKGDVRVMRMGTASVPRLVVEFAIPSVVGMVVNGSYAIVNSVFLGNAMGEVGLSAITVANPMLIVFMAFAMLVGNGGNALAALRLGEGRRYEAERALGNVVLLSIVLAVLVALAASNPFILDWVLTVSSSTEDVRPYASIYIQILSFGFIFQMIGMGVNNFIRTAGAPVRALVTMVIGLVSAAVFNYFFVILFGWGIVGSALASLAGQALSCIAVLWYFIGVKDAPMHLRLRCMKPDPRFMSSIFALGFPSFAMQTGMAVINFILNYQLVKYGAMTVIGAENALASIGVVQRVAQFSVFPVIGVATAIQPLLGYNYGARLVPRAQHVQVRRHRGHRHLCFGVVDHLPVHDRHRERVRHRQRRPQRIHRVRDARAVHHAAYHRLPDRVLELLPGDRPTREVDLPLAYAPDPLPHPAYLVPARSDPPYRPVLARA